MSEKTMPLISVVTPCYNEEGNCEKLHALVQAEFDKLPGYRHEHVFIDNASKDGTARILRQIAAKDPNVRVILNARNFGHIRSPYHAMLQSSGDATILMAGDLQDPPNLIPTFIKKWEEGFKTVMGVKNQSEETPLMFALRKLYYKFLGRLSDVHLIKNATGFGLYDRRVIDLLREIDDPYPYFRGLVTELGFEIAQVPFIQPARKRGITSNNFYTLYDIAWLGITSHSKIPLRLATMLGFLLSGLSLSCRDSVLHRQAGFLGQVSARDGADHHQLFLFHVNPAALHRDYWRVSGIYLHPGSQAAAGRREGANWISAGERVGKARAVYACGGEGLSYLLRFHLIFIVLFQRIT